MTLVLIAVLATLGQAGGQTSEEAVDAAEQAIVRDIDSTLPETPFGTWLSSVVGEGADIGWSVNDCGEQVGDPEIDRARDIPMCAEARVRLEDGRLLSVSLVVGNWTVGVGDEPPSFWSAYLMESGGRPQWLSELTEVPGSVAGR